MATESSEVQLTKCCPPGHLLSGGQGEPLCVDQGDSDLSTDLEIKAFRKSETGEAETASVVLRSDQDFFRPVYLKTYKVRGLCVCHEKL